MKRRLLFLAVMLTTILGLTNTASALNSYAYGLKSQVVDGKISITYSVNESALNGAIIFTNGTETETIDLTADDVTTGEHSKVVSLTKFSKGDKLTWSVKVTGNVVKEATENSKFYQFYHPAGVVVDNNYESPYYGRIYATECMPAPAKDKYHSYQQGQGVYAFDPQLKPIENAAGKYVFTGGISFQTKFANAKTSYDPYRLALSEDGRLFVSGQNTNGTVLWEINPDDLNAKFTPIISGTADETTYELKDAEGNFVAAPNVGMDVMGKGKDLKVVMLSTNVTGLGLGQTGFRTDVYNIGEGSTTPNPVEGLSHKYALVYANTSVIFDGEGGYWFLSNRAKATEKEPTLVHISKDGVEDYIENADQNRAGGGGIALCPDKKHLAIGCPGKTIKIYEVSKDEAGKPVLTETLSFASNMGTNVKDIAWDNADNLYLVGNSGEYLKVFALPRENGDVTTPAASKYEIEMPFAMSSTLGTAKKGDNVTVNGLVTALCSRGFILTDNSGSILVYFASGFDATKYKIGDQIALTGMVSSYNKGLQIASTDATFTVEGNQAYTYPTPKVMDGEAFDNALTRTTDELAEYAQFAGEVTISGNYINIAVDGAETAQGSVYMATTAQKAMFTNGKEYTVKGYFISISGKKYVNFVVTEAEEYKEPELYVMGQIEGTGYVATVDKGQKMTNEGNGKYTATIKVAEAEGSKNPGSISFSTKLGASDADIEATLPYILGAEYQGKPLAQGVNPAALTKGVNNTFELAAGSYTLTVDLNALTVSVASPDFKGVYIVGQAEETEYRYAPTMGIELKKDEADGLYKGTATFASSATAEEGSKAFFGLSINIGSDEYDWTTFGANTYGPATGNTQLENETATSFTKGTNSFTVVKGKYDVIVDWDNQKVTVKGNGMTGVDDTELAGVKVIGGYNTITVVGEAQNVAIYNTNGALVSKAREANVAAGIYLVVVDGKTFKVAVK